MLISVRSSVFFFLFHLFNLSSLFKTTDFWQPLQYFQNPSMKLIMKWLKHPFHTDLFPCSETITVGHVCLSDSNHNIHAHRVPFTYKLQRRNRAHGPSLTHTPAPLKPQSETLRFPYTDTNLPPYTPAPANTHLRLLLAKIGNTRCVWESTCSK